MRFSAETLTKLSDTDAAGQGFLVTLRAANRIASRASGLGLECSS